MVEKNLVGKQQKTCLPFMLQIFSVRDECKHFQTITSFKNYY